MVRKILTSLASIALIVSFSGLSLSCSKKATNSNTNTSNDKTNNGILSANSSDYASNLSNNLNTAQNLALGWNKDAQLVYVAVKIPFNLTPEQINTTYVYSSGKLLNNWWTVNIDLKTGNYIRAIIPKADYLNQNLFPISTQYWQVNFIDALKKADGSGGKDFRNNNQNNFQIEADLYRTDPNNYLHWVITYKTLDGSKSTSVKIDAASGDVTQGSNGTDSTNSSTNNSSSP